LKTSAMVKPPFGASRAPGNYLPYPFLHEPQFILRPSCYEHNL
jgi:hypothetical protein